MIPGLLVLPFCALAAQQPAESPETAKARAEVARVERLVEEGGLPRARLEEARQAFAEAEDQAVLRRTLYGALSVQELTEDLNLQMIESARRLLDRQQQKVEKTRLLIEEGALGRIALTPLLEEKDARRRTLDLAESRVRLWNELAGMARAEQQRQLEAAELAALAAAEEDPGYGVLPSGRLGQLAHAFETAFFRPFPVSARGDTNFHRALGFNHTGRIDVALNPDSLEGRWLRGWLEEAG
ncbi:MAG: hypothetical protein HY235_26375, partial [Acidobacteria bacterium]|nr:hypothetical protein [Acidobacteriota bacterium]